MHIVIIGFGISGVSVAKTLREQSNADITIVTSESRSFFSRTMCLVLTHVIIYALA